MYYNLKMINVSARFFFFFVFMVDLTCVIGHSSTCIEPESIVPNTDSVADPDPGLEQIRYGSGSRPNFGTDPDPGK